MNPFETYGIKEVADVMFFKLKPNGEFGECAFVLDSLKISTPEVTSESTQQKGGKGAPTLLDWSYGKDIMVNLQDALVSMKTLATVLGGDELEHEEAVHIWKNQEAIVEEGESDTLVIGLNYEPSTQSSIQVLAKGAEVTGLTGKTVTLTGVEAGDTVKVAYQTEVAANKSYEIVIGPKKFPGYYGMVGDTVIRRKTDGVDEGFQFILPKIKFNTQATLSFESEGDAAVFDMEIIAMVANNKTQMSLVKYDIGDTDTELPSNLNEFVAEE